MYFFVSATAFLSCTVSFPSPSSVELPAGAYLLWIIWYFNKMAYSSKCKREVTWESPSSSSSFKLRMIGGKCNTWWSFYIWIIAIASAVIVLAWLRLKEERRKKWFAGLLLQWCSPMKLMVPLLMEALGNAWHSWRPLTNLTQTFWTCHLRTFNVAVIFFFWAIPTYGILLYTKIMYPSTFDMVNLTVNFSWTHGIMNMGFEQWCFPILICCHGN